MRCPRVAWLVLLVAACGGKTAQSYTTDANGSAQFWIKSKDPAGQDEMASFSLDAEFLLPGASSCTTTTIGACTVNPCVESPSTVEGKSVTNGGAVTLVTSTMTAVIQPGSDGSYATGAFDGAPWTTGGASVTLEWADFPGTTTGGGGALVAATPPYVTLSPGSPFAKAISTVDRSSDLTFSWTSDTTPASTDVLGVYFDSGPIQVGCNFVASAGFGVVPSAALMALGAGAGSFDIHSKRTTTTKQTAPDGSLWSFGVNADAAARTAYGVASGKVTFQ